MKNEMIGGHSKWISRKDRVGIRRIQLFHRWGSKTRSVNERRAPLFRREFTLDDSVMSATLNICGLGYYEVWINNERVGDHVLDPAQSDYKKRVFYVSYDVTEMVKTGTNCIGVMLGNGWYNQDRVWGKNGLSYGRPQLICELHIKLPDDNMVVVGSDEDWTWTPGPVIENNIYAGESYDARLELPGWDRPGYDDSSWDSAVIVSDPGGRMEIQEMPPIRKVGEILPIGLNQIADGRYVVDMGQNFSGWVRIQVEAKVGSEITLRFAEVLTKDGNLDTASTGVFATKVEQIDHYIAKGEGVEIWEPRFTYHGFRFVEVSDWPGNLNTDSIIGVIVHTDLTVAGNFESSDKRLNQLHNMALWTHRSNIHSIPEDCPARERCGWLGDANLVAEFSMWNYHAKSFWEKYLDDIETTRSTNNGIPCNIAPGKRGTRGNAKPDWAAAYIMLPWYVYIQYGDPSVLKKHWEGMQHLMRHYAEKSEHWILKGGYGDWFDPGDKKICNNTPPTLTSTFWFYRCATVMSSAAKALFLLDKAEHYALWGSNIRDSVINRYYSREHGSFGSQTANAMAIEFGIIPDGEKSRILNALVVDIRERNNHLSTGIMGVRYVFEVMTRHGHGDLALALMHQNSYPSFGHLIQSGATTLWEYWGENKHDIIHGARSRNHPMMGGFDNWFYNTLAGIRPDPEQPGFQRFSLTPHSITGLDWIRCHFDSPCGRIVSDWKCKDGIFEWIVVVPEGTNATAELPFTHQIHNLVPGSYKFVDRLPGV